MKSTRKFRLCSQDRVRSEVDRLVRADGLHCFVGKHVVTQIAQATVFYPDKVTAKPLLLDPQILDLCDSEYNMRIRRTARYELVLTWRSRVKPAEDKPSESSMAVDGSDSKISDDAAVTSAAAAPKTDAAAPSAAAAAKTDAPGAT